MDSPAPDPAPVASAPPTVPGAIPTSVDRPTSRLSVASLVCGFIGFVVPGVNVAAIVLGILGLRRIARARPRQQGHAFAIVGICLGAAGIIVNLFVLLMTMGAVVAVRQSGAWMAGPNLVAVHGETVRYAGTTGEYPIHVAELMTDEGYAPVHIMVTDRIYNGQPGLMTLGDYDFSGYVSDDASREAVQDVIDAMDHAAPYYRFGDRWFVRLAAPTQHRDIVFAWSDGWANNVRTVQFDDGRTRMVDRGGWAEVWRKDAVARLGLAPLAAPADAADDPADPGDGPEAGEAG